MPGVNYRVAADVAVLEIDNPPVNALSLAVRQGLMDGLIRALADTAVTAVVVCGARECFAAGADINEIASGMSRQPPAIREIQAHMEASRKPLVAAIEGSALGGGFEIALACHWRVCARSGTVGLPEVRLGLIPGAGGTQRFTRLAGPQAALQAITTGSALPAAQALALRLVDEVADAALPAAMDFARRVVAQGCELRLASQLTDRVSNVDPAVFAEFRTSLQGRARGQLAPWRIVDAIEAACQCCVAEALRLERQWFEECCDSPQHAALTHLFFAEREARRIPDIPAAVKPLPLRKVGVVGAGTMGAAIAMSCANAAIPVTLLDMSQRALDRGLGAIRGNYAAALSRGSLAPLQMQERLALIQGTLQYEALADADLIVEAAFEDLQIKRSVFATLDGIAAPAAILATNTSALDIDAIAAATARAHNVVGMHFFSPANVMRLIEAVRGRSSSPQAIATVMALARRLGKVCVLAGNCAGFIGNRMLQFYSYEAEFLLEEGASPEQIDRVAEDFGFAMGPLAMRDLAGNDVGLLIRQHRLLPADERRSPILERLVAAGRLGQKAGKGFYRYEGRRRIVDPQVDELIERVARESGYQRRAIADTEILERLLHPLVNEGAKVLAEGIALRASDIDVVYVNGYGFPAWRGGPMFWAQQVGLHKVLATVQELAPSHGSRWQAAPLLIQLAERGGGWPQASAGQHRRAL